ncbi:MAG: hypothetical protein UHD09_00790 [Bifidobacterium sp.]|nr:hypothetical protein [Bifidobacterium sp.]
MLESERLANVLGMSGLANKQAIQADTTPLADEAATLGDSAPQLRATADALDKTDFAKRIQGATTSEPGVQGTSFVIVAQ